MFRNSIPPPRPYSPPSFDEIFGGNVGGGGGGSGGSGGGEAEFSEQDRGRNLENEVRLFIMFIHIYYIYL